MGINVFSILYVYLVWKAIDRIGDVSAVRERMEAEDPCARAYLCNCICIFVFVFVYLYIDM